MPEKPSFTTAFMCLVCILVAACGCAAVIAATVRLVMWILGVGG